MGRRVNLRGPAGKLTHNVIKERKESKRESQRSGAEKCKECAEKQWEFILANRKLMSSLFFRFPLRTLKGTLGAEAAASTLLTPAKGRLL